MILLVDTWHYR